MRKSVKVCLLMSYGAAILVSAALYGFAEPLYRLFTTDSNVVRIGADMMHFLLPSYFMYVVIGILSGALRGAGRVLVPMLLTCGGVCLIRIADVYKRQVLDMFLRTDCQKAFFLPSRLVTTSSFLRLTN